MKRLVAALAALLLCAPMAGAKVLVVTDTYTNSGSDAVSTQLKTQQQRLVGAVFDVLNRTGACYDVTTMNAMKTEWARTGSRVIGWNGSSGTSTIQYDAIIWLNEFGHISTASTRLPNPPSYNGCFPCSLTTQAKRPTVPQLWVYGATVASGLGGGGSVQFTDFRNASGACSTGVQPLVTPGGAYGYAYAGPPRSPNSSWLVTANVGMGYSGGVFNGLSQKRNATPPAGGVRALEVLGFGTFPAETQIGSRSHACAWCDSAMSYQSGDTMQVWERPNAASGQNVVTGGNLIFANVMGASPCADSLISGGSFNIPCEFDAPALMVALARLDSLTRGGVWCSTSRLPIKASVVIGGAFKRNGRNNYPGILETDSTAHKAFLDSLATLPIPYTIVADVDSVASRPNELAWWAKLARARYSPIASAGVRDSTGSGVGNTSTTFPVDLFGRFRARAFYGDSLTHTVQTGDTSIVQGLKAVRSLAATYWAGKLSGLCVAAFDDYSPVNWRNKTGQQDSLIYAVRAAGFTALETDVHSRDASFATYRRVSPRKPDAGAMATNPDLLRGYYDRQQYVTDNIGGTGRFKILGQTGFSQSGSQYWADTTALGLYGGTGAFGSGASTPPVPSQIGARFWHGFVHDEFTDFDWFPYDDNQILVSVPVWYQMGRTKNYEDAFAFFHHASILRLNASDFSGLPSGPPAGPGWWALKSIYNQFAYINKLAGRTVFAFDWPENVEP